MAPAKTNTSRSLSLNASRLYSQSSLRTLQMLKCSKLNCLDRLLQSVGHQPATIQPVPALLSWKLGSKQIQKTHLRDRQCVGGIASESVGPRLKRDVRSSCRGGAAAPAPPGPPATCPCPGPASRKPSRSLGVRALCSRLRPGGVFRRELLRPLTLPRVAPVRAPARVRPCACACAHAWAVLCSATLCHADVVSCRAPRHKSGAVAPCTPLLLQVFQGPF